MPKLGRNPLLDADPASLPPWRKGDRKAWGGLFNYIRAVNPGPPPLGWRDITPYFGEKKMSSITAYQKMAANAGYILQTQTYLPQQGLPYRRIAVALSSHLPSTKAARKASP